MILVQSFNVYFLPSVSHREYYKWSAKFQFCLDVNCSFYRDLKLLRISHLLFINILATALPK